MDHASIDHANMDDHQMAERYLLGQLPPAEAARFEEHSLACPECLDRLEAAEKLRLGLRTVAARDVAAEVVKRTLLARIVRSRLAPFAILVLFLVAVLPAGLLWRRVGHLESELTASREALRRSPQNPPADPSTARAAADEQRRLYETERSERERLAAELEKARGPRINVPVVPLSPERSAPGGAPATRVSLAPATDWVVLSLELAAVEHARYRATLIGPGGKSLWQSSDLHPDAQVSLTIALPAAQLQPGDFTVRVEGLSGQGQPAAVADYSFRLVRGS